MPKKMGRPVIEINMDTVKTLLRNRMTLKDLASYFGVSDDTIERRIRKFAGVTFAEFQDQNLVHTRVQLVNRAIKKALEGDNKMLTLCLINFCGWRTRPPDDHDNTNINIKVEGSSHKVILDRLNQIRLETGEDEIL